MQNTYLAHAVVTLQKPKDPVKFAVELQSYRELKARLIIDTATFGVVGSLLTSLVRLPTGDRIESSSSQSVSRAQINFVCSTLFDSYDMDA